MIVSFLSVIVYFLSVIVMLEDRGFVSVVLKYDAVFVKGLMVDTSVILLPEYMRSAYSMGRPI